MGREYHAVWNAWCSAAGAVSHPGRRRGGGEGGGGQMGHLPVRRGRLHAHCNVQDGGVFSLRQCVSIYSHQ